jgi:hypothetical protein
MLKILNEGKIIPLFNKSRPILPEGYSVYNFQKEHLYSFNNEYVK